MSANQFFGEGKPCFIIAEIGANHNGDIELCLETMKAAAETGVDAIKLQYYTGAELVADVERVWAWGPEGNQTEEPVGAMFDRLGLDKSEMAIAYERAEELGIILFTTPFSVQGVADLEELGNPIYKVASSDLAFYPMLRAIDEIAKPVIISTGKSPMTDVKEAIAVMEKTRTEDVALLHCIAQYPAPYDQMNIRVVASFQEDFPEHPIGLSDHSMTDEPALAAVALGGAIIEKHFTLAHDQEGPDHWFSMDPEQMARLVTKVRRIEASLGDGVKDIQRCEEWEATYSRRSIIVMRDVAQGQEIVAEDLALLRPGTGLHPKRWDDVLGRKAKRTIAAREPLIEDMLE